IALAGNEFLSKKPGIVSLHAVTACNALHFIHNAAGDDANRKLALLQAAGWLPAYRDRVKTEAGHGIDSLEPLEPKAKGEEAVAEIFETIGKSRDQAARKTLGYLNAGGSLAPIFAAQRRMIFQKGRDSHDYKYGAAVWEEAMLASDPKWQAT